MEPKQYQKGVLNDLSRYLALLAETGDMAAAYARLWAEKNVPVGEDGVPPYRKVIAGVPSVCMKVPTGGGKTFLAACAIKSVFDSLPEMRTRAVVWLVPSDSILEQTRRALGNPQHPYRQRIDVDFGGRVEVYEKSQLLGGQNFSPASVADQLSIFVLSYDSFRASKKEGRKAHQENANLAPFVRYRNDAVPLLPDTDETALIQVIRSFNPLVMVDESHHATSPLSLDMLDSFNPCLILELTATPHRNSNIISFVDAVQLKREHMVKLPVIVYNRKTQEDVFGDAIHLRDRLETEAERERVSTGHYIRPIVLLQAQPRIGEDSTTFDRIKRALLASGIPAEQIAIRTSDINELKQVDLASEACPIRYIITVNALREGWDCPFAYILATVANRSSSVDVEQILGRVLRLPYAMKNKSDVLNISYVLTSSADFHGTLEKVVAGLNQAGFSRHDMLVRDEAAEATIGQISSGHANDTENGQEALEDMQIKEETSAGESTGISGSAAGIEAPVDYDAAAIRARRDAGKAADDHVLQSMQGEETPGKSPAPDTGESVPETDDMIAGAVAANAAYEREAEEVLQHGEQQIPVEVRARMKSFRMNPHLEPAVTQLLLPQFMIETGPSMFEGAPHEPLQKEHLSAGFTLRDKDLQIDFSTMAAEMALVDVKSEDDTQPKAWKITGSDNAWFRAWFASLPSAQRLSHCRQLIHRHLSSLDVVDDTELQAYADRVIQTLTADQLAELEQSPLRFGERIKTKVSSLLAQHAASTFDLWYEQGLISCQPHYAFPNQIAPASYTTTIPKSLYMAEEAMNHFEQDVVWVLSAMENIRWWHRNLSRLGFCINGNVHAYPDLIAMTGAGKILLIETKGDHLEGPESEAKARLGAKWAQAAGREYRYFMVFDKKQPTWPGAYSRERFI